MTLEDSSRRRALQSAAALAVAMAYSSLAAQSEAFPRRPVRIVVGFPPGGSGDFIARVLSDLLAAEFRVPVLVDNRPGAGSNIASEVVARAEADGHTLLLGGNFSHAVNPVLFKKVSFDPLNDFTPITKIADLPTIIAVNPATNVKTLRELVRRAKAEPGRWNYSTPGLGTPSHLAGAMLGRVSGAQFTHIAYKGGGPAITAAISGEVQLTIGTPPAVLPHLASGRLRALCLTTRSRSPVIPDIPGTEEAGLPGLDIQGWWALWGPAKLPAAVRDRIHGAMLKVLDTPQARGRFAREGLAITTSRTPREFDLFVREQIPFWAKVVSDSGAVAE